MLVTSQYGSSGRAIWRHLEEGTVTIESGGTSLRAVIRQNEVVEQCWQEGDEVTRLRYGRDCTVTRAGKVVKQEFYEPGSLQAIRRGGLWKRQTDLQLGGSAGVLECYATAGGLYAREIFTYANGVQAYVAQRGQEKLAVGRPNGRPWIVLAGRIRPGPYPIAQRLSHPGVHTDWLPVVAGLDLQVTMYGPSGTRVVTQGAYVNRRREGRWLENGRVAYYFAGVKVSRTLGKGPPDRWDAWEVLRVPNAQLRSRFLNQLGYQRLLEQVEPEVIDTDDGSQLLGLTVTRDRYTPVGIDRTMRLLRVICPSTGAVYILRVPPEVQTCRQARHWTLGLNLDQVQEGARFDLVQET